MNASLAMLLDANLVDHWPDFILGPLIAIVAWLLKRDISGMDKRFERSEDKFEKQDATLADHETRITVIERTGGRQGGQA